MSALIQIGGVELAPVEYRGVRVMTLGMMDSVHKRPDGTARRNFNENKARLVEGEDFSKVSANEIRTHKICAISNKSHEDMILLTETGYSMLVKSFTDDLAWDVQRQLVRSYFGGGRKSIDNALNLDGAFQALRLAPLAVRAARAFGLDKNVAAISANQYVCAVTGHNLLKEFGSTHLLAENQETQWFTPTELKGESKVSAQKLNAALEAAGLQARRGKTWELTPAGHAFARLFDTGKKHDSGAMVQQIKWSPNVLLELRSTAPLLGGAK